jgi:membrane associated rhomboid family serine protease
MQEIPVPVDRREFLLDLCRECQFVWFDSREFEQLPVVAETPKPGQALPLETREKAAMAQIKLRAELDALQGDGVAEATPEELPQWVTAALGPTTEAEPVRSMPWLTWGLAAVLVLSFLLTYPDAKEAIKQFGLIPDQAFRHGGLTWLASLFIHRWPLHLAVNVFFLVIFGSHVEDYLGRWRYLALLSLTALCGNLTYFLLEPRGGLPSAGASGAISGIIAFYALRFPRARLPLARGLYMPAYVFLALWVFLECLWAALRAERWCEVSSLSYLGGVLAGVAAWIAWRNR